jgi:DNA helicase-2/ATP-dependent DNA helicase PcrA
MSDGALRARRTQLEAVTTLRGPVVVLAGAGTGKTRVITHRIAHGVDTGAYSPGRVMAVTFTAKAAGEMRGACGARVSRASRAHVPRRRARAAQLLLAHRRGRHAPGIVDNKVRCSRTPPTAWDRARRRDPARRRERDRVAQGHDAQHRAVRRRAAERRRPARGLARRRPAARVREAQGQRRSSTSRTSCSRARACSRRSRTSRASVHEQYRHFTVDEFQDVSPLQHRLLELWRGDRRDICVVGDASQTIYSFAGADARFLLDFAGTHEDARVVRLETNYRSDAAILAVANELMRGRPGALQLTAAAREESAARTSTDASQVDPPTVTAYDDDVAEARGVAAQIAARIGAGIDPRRIAILYRAHSQSAELVRALADHGIAATVLGGRGSSRCRRCVRP